MPASQASDRNLAMLIDGDNAQATLLEQTFEEVSRHGTITICRAYGDWGKPDMAKWQSAMLTHAIQPIQQWRYSVGKNATDSALIIDAMDILYSGTVQGFCIVSSDGDYTRLCMRIRESGLFVMGIGRKQTPEAFVKACKVFVHVENLKQTDKTTQPKKPEPEKTTKNKKKLMSLMRQAFDISENDDGWVSLDILGQALHRLDPSFVNSTYGHRRLSALIMDLPDQFALKGVKKTGPSIIYVRLKDK